MKIKLPVWSWILAIILIDKVIKVFVLASGIPFQINNGLAFGVGASENPFLLLFPVVFVVLVFYMAMKYGRSYSAFFIILAGALANLSDRFIWGGVMDYIQIGELPVFNLADLIIFFGTIKVCIKIFTNKPASERRKISGDKRSRR